MRFALTDMAGRRIEIVGARAVGSLERLEPLALAIFGTGDRSPGWFAKKLWRECIDPDLTTLAFDADRGDPSEPHTWLGYVLVGTPPSLAPTARTAGAGVVREVRGQGVGRRMFARIESMAADRGLRAIVVPSEQAVEPWFARLGYRRIRSMHTLLAFGRGDGSSSPPWGHPLAWDPAKPTEAVFGWLREAWERTPEAFRCTLTLDSFVVHCSLEGRAWVVHRLVEQAPDARTVDRYAVDATHDSHAIAVAAACDRLVDLAPESTPIVLPHLDEVSSVTRALELRGWVPVQRGSLMQREIDVPRSRSLYSP